MAEPLILAFGRNILRDFSGLPDSVLDIIPADLVVNTVLAVAANPHMATRLLAGADLVHDRARQAAEREAASRYS